jgi:hypothetical protein
VALRAVNTEANMSGFLSWLQGSFPDAVCITLLIVFLQFIAIFVRDNPRKTLIVYPVLYEKPGFWAVGILKGAGL